MAHVLKDVTMDTEEKLATYNNLMTRSQILTSKAKSMFMKPYTHDSAPPPPPSDIDTHFSGDETKPEKRPIPVQQKTKKKFSDIVPEALAKEINKVPISYREAVKKTLSQDEHWKGFSRSTSLHQKWLNGA